jgi:hypothetical protein
MGKRGSSFRGGAHLLVVLGLLALPLDGGSAQGDLEVTAGAVRVDLTGRVQTQLATTSCSEFPFDPGSPCTEQAPGPDLFMRRVRFAATVTIAELERGGDTVPFIVGKVEPDFADVDAVVLRDAYGRLNFSDAVRVQIGQFKRPFDGFNLVSSSRLLTVERDLDVAGVPGIRAASLGEFADRFNLGSYDIGGMVFGEVLGGRIGYSIGVFNGEPSEVNNDRNAAKQFIGRLRYGTRVAGLPLSVEAATAVTDLPFEGAEDQPGRPRSGEFYRDHEVFVELGDYEPGPHVQAGVIFGDNPLQGRDGEEPALGGESDPDFAPMRAWQIVGAYRWAVPGTPFVEGLEPAVRVTRAEPNGEIEGDEVWGFTPGVNLYFHGRNKLQLNWDLVRFGGDRFDGVDSFKAQFQVYF